MVTFDEWHVAKQKEWHEMDIIYAKIFIIGLILFTIIALGLAIFT